MIVASSSFSGAFTGGSSIVLPAAKARRAPAAVALTVECSSRPQKKATAHHMKTRPKKTQPWDVKRKGPTHYPPLPALPPDWTLVSSGPSPDPSVAMAQKEQEEEEEDSNP